MEGFLVGLLIVLFGILSLEIGMSAPILEIIAGVVGANIFNLTEIPWMDFVSNFGILGLMFFAGLEVDKEELKRNAKSSSLLALAAYFVPFASVLGVSSLLFKFNIKTSALIAVSLSTTSLALVYPVLKEKKLLDEKIGHILFTSAMLIDVLSMVSLAAIFGIFDYLTLIFFVITAIFMHQAPKLGKWVFARYKESIAEIESKFMLLMLLSLLFFSERTNVNEAILAFIMGFLFSEILEDHDALIEKLKGIVFGFMAPIFFFKAGSFMTLKSMTLHAAVLTMVLLPTAFLSKYLSARALLPRTCPSDERCAKLAGMIFNFRLTFGIVSALFGLEVGIITKDAYTAIITTIISSSIISSVMIKLSKRNENQSSTSQKLTPERHR